MNNSVAAWDERAALPTSWQAALWSEVGQSARFHAILSHLTFRSGDVLLDFGCGTGAFCEFLPRYVRYTAWDWSPKMRDRVREEHPRAEVLEEIPSASYDHIVCCGTFNLADNWSKEATWEQIADLWSRTRVSLIASLHRGEFQGGIFYQPQEALAFADRLGVRRFSLDASVLDNDFLLCLQR